MRVPGITTMGAEESHLTLPPRLPPTTLVDAAMHRAFRIMVNLSRMSDDALLREISVRRQLVEAGGAKAKRLAEDMKGILPKGFRERSKWRLGIGKLRGDARRLFAERRTQDGLIAQRLAANAKAKLRQLKKIEADIEKDRKRLRNLVKERDRRVSELEKRRSRSSRARLTHETFTRGAHVSYTKAVLSSLEQRGCIAEDLDDLAEEAGLGRFNLSLRKYWKAVESYWESARDPTASDEEVTAKTDKVNRVREAASGDLQRCLFRAVNRWTENRYLTQTRAERSDAADEIQDSAYLCLLEASHLDREE